MVRTTVVRAVVVRPVIVGTVVVMLASVAAVKPAPHRLVQRTRPTSTAASLPFHAAATRCPCGCIVRHRIAGVERIRVLETNVVRVVRVVRVVCVVLSVAAVVAPNRRQPAKNHIEERELI